MASSASLEQTPLSTYKSIIPEKCPDWPGATSPSVVRLHAKFWGKSNFEAELIQTFSGTESMNVDKDEDEDEDEDMGEDGDEVEGDEIGPGCGILNIGIPTLRSKIWIRQEYLRLYKFCEDQLGSNLLQELPSVVITGQPGIGKSFWVIYAICRRLSEGKPVMWYHADNMYLFVQEGVFMRPDKYPPTDFEIPIWTLVDADEDRYGVPSFLAVHDTQHLIIFTSSPQSARWKALGKTTNCKVAIMNPWTREEISRAAVMYGLTESDRIDEMYNQLGPTPRICFNFLKNEHALIEYKARYQGALGNLSLEKLGEMCSQSQKLSIDAASRTVLLVRRVPRKDLIRANLNIDDGKAFSYGSSEPITHAVELELRNQLRKSTRAAKIKLYKSLANVEGTGRIAGLVFEYLAQETLQKEINLDLVPMVKRQSSTGKKLFRWHSVHEDSTSSSSVRPVCIKPNCTEVYSGSGPDKIKDRVFYVPEAPNQVAFDSFIMADQKLFLFQFTMGLDHPIKKEIISFFSKKSPPPRADWHFVFIVPTGPRSIVSCSHSQEPGLMKLLDEMNLSSAVTDPEAE